MKTNSRSTVTGDTHHVLTLNALSMCMALALPGLASPAWAACDNQVLPPNTNCAANVTAGATVTGTTINATGSQNVSSGGATVSTTINSGGKQTIQAGGTDTQAVVKSGGTQTVSGSASWATVNAGGKQIVSSGGATTNTTINSGGSQTIMTGASDNLAVVIGGGTQIVSGVASGSTVAGKQTVSSGGAAFGATVNSGGTQSIAAGGQASGTVINNGGLQAVAGSAQGATINNGGKQTVSAGGTASNTVVNNGGLQTVAGGVVSGTVINSGGSASVTSGGTAIGTVVSAFARQTVTSGTAINTVLVGAVSSGGTQYISAGGNAINTSIGQKARQTVYAGGTATSAQVLSAGTQSVSSGGLATGTTVFAGGMQQVLGGGVATGSVINSGATASLFVGGTSAGGTVPSPVFTSGSVAGTLQIATTSSVAITGNALATANSLALAGGAVVFTAPDTAGYKTLVINGLSGAGSFSLNSNVASGQSDQLVINGAQGSYTVVLSDTSTTTPAAGSRMQLISGNTNGASFTMANGGVDVGAERYGFAAGDGGYYLFDTGRLGDAASIAQALPSVANMIWYQQLEQTYGRLEELRSGTSDQGLWVRVFAQKFRTESSGVSSSVEAGGVQFGRDLRFGMPYGNLFVGLAGGVAQAKTTVGSNGTANSYPWNVGVYGGLAGMNGWFGEGALRFLSGSNDFATTGNANSGNYHTGGFMGSIAGGRRFSLPGDWTVEPRMSLTYLHANSGSYTFDSGMPVSLGGQDSALASVGVTVSKPFTVLGLSVRPFASLNGVHMFSGTQTVTVAGTDISAQTPGNWITATAGMAVMLERGMRFSADMSYAKGQAYTRPFAVNVGLTYQK
ncbi:autotransporter outer membrane beta-barrel domain-containing protein [Pandoraea apista]|uniref:autotransporter outer membrane beta-barrel domain-containing protein n=1 Tax=Pandoraea apista TaxID=93218 RepID=UPI00248ED7C6|nr:autotransporter outer membrane beta-barrel domain-containing protein [Pandoraea apista]